MRASFSTDECACSEHTTTLRPVAWRAAISAASVEVDAVSSMWPCHSRGMPISWATQSSTVTSSSVEAGAVRQRIATEFRVAASSSARMPGSADGDCEVGEEPRVLPVRDAREEDLVEVAEHRGERLRLLGRRLRQPRADLPRLDLGEHGQLAHPFEVVGRPVDGAVAVLAEGHFFAFTFDQGCVFTTCSLVSQARLAWPIPSVA